MMLLIQLVLVLTGLLMVIAPVSCVRKELRGDKAVEKSTRRMGVWFIAAAVIWFITAKVF